jgi:glycosyltransferase involved in cell wall biosynthesis
MIHALLPSAPHSASPAPGAPPARVLLVVSSLEHGGAERQVVELARNLDPRRFDPVVCSLSDDVPLAGLLPDPARQLVIVRKRWRFDAATVPRVARLMRKLGTQVAHGFLFDAEIVARAAGRLAGVPVIVGSERNSDYRRPRLQLLALRATRRWVQAVVANSEAGRRFGLRTLGLPADSVHVIPNGVDVARFSPGDAAAARRTLGLPPDRPVVGMVASFKPQKNHPMFLDVARRVLAREPRALFLCAGEPLRGAGGAFSLRAGTGAHRDVAGYHREVARSLGEGALAESCRLLGRVDEVERVYRACDVTVLTSRHEGTPNVVLESMACAVPVVVTDVADNARLVGDGVAGYVVPLDDAPAMAARLLDLLGDDARRRQMGRAARAHVESAFSLAAMARRTEELYATLLARAGIAGGGVTA